MNKKQLIRQVATTTDIPIVFAEEIVRTTFDMIAQVMEDQDSIVIHGFGRFGSKKRAARTGRNPQTGAELNIAEAIVPVFKASTQLKNRLKTISTTESA